MRSTPFIALGCFAATTLLAGAAAAGDPYDDAFRGAQELESEGRLDEAARVLAFVLPLYPQDYALPLSIAWIHYRAGRFQAAEGDYRLALERSPGAVEARLGLAASIERQGRCDDARPLYAGLVAERPDMTEARAGLARCAPVPAWRITASLAATGATFPGHSVKSLAGGSVVAATFAHRSGFFFGGAYRYTRFSAASGSGESAWDQHEAFANLGYSRKLGGFALHYAFAHDGSGTLGDSHHVGIDGRWSPFGDIELQAAASFYDDMLVFRLSPSWRIPIAFGLSIRPAVDLQYADGEVLATGMGTLAFDHSRFSLWAGAKYGDAVRPVYFGLSSIYDVTEKSAWGAWAGASVNVSDDVRIHLSYTMDRMKQTSGTATSAHALTLGLAVSF